MQSTAEKDGARSYGCNFTRVASDSAAASMRFFFLLPKKFPKKKEIRRWNRNPSGGEGVEREGAMEEDADGMDHFDIDADRPRWGGVLLSEPPGESAADPRRRPLRGLSGGRLRR
jgi:hypothetical protein